VESLLKLPSVSPSWLHRDVFDRLRAHIGDLMKAAALAAGDVVRRALRPVSQLHLGHVHADESREHKGSACSQPRDEWLGVLVQPRANEAQVLYLDFINLFLYLLRLFGRRR
jgi:hypothetical protein